METTDTNTNDSNAAINPERLGEKACVQRVGRPRRGAPIGLMGLVAMTAAIGGTVGLPMGRTEEKPHEPTKYDHERLREAALKRQRRAAKKAENIRRTKEGQRPTDQAHRLDEAKPSQRTEL